MSDPGDAADAPPDAGSGGGSGGSYHSVLPGDHISSIASKFGFRDFKLIWNAPQNKDLRGQRANPHVLFPGDQLYIPDKQKKEISRSTDAQHVFKVPAASLKLILLFDRFYGAPLANRSCTFTVGDDEAKLATDGDGKVQRAIKLDAGEGDLQIDDKLTGKSPDGSPLVQTVDIDMGLHIGHLDPESQTSGQLSRLANLGYYRGPEDPVDQAELLSAIEEFQCDNGIAYDDGCGPATQAKLKEIHGC
jgi:N-acetylmuramoyl-L-alanine amidase